MSNETNTEIPVNVRLTKYDAKKLDIFVDKGVYFSRSDAIRDAIRKLPSPPETKS